MYLCIYHLPTWTIHLSIPSLFISVICHLSIIYHLSSRYVCIQPSLSIYVSIYVSFYHLSSYHLYHLSSYPLSVCLLIPIYLSSIYVSIYGEIHFKELAHVIMGSSRSQIFRVGQQAGNPRKTCSLSLKAVRKQNSLLLGGSQSLFYGGRQRIRRGPPTPGRATCFPQSPLI